jgi:RNA polymerase sigma factor (sigma-70 family)
MTCSLATDLEVFESHRVLLVAHAYHMLGDLGRAEDMVQEAWLRWDGRHEEVDSPRAYLVTIVTRLCFNELDSAKVRREENRGDRLPEPLDPDAGGIGRVEMLDQISMAFLVVLQRLTPAERAVLLLRDVFDFDYKDISALVGKNEPACRKLLERARENVAKDNRLFSASPETHQRLLTAFTQAAGDLDALVSMLAEDAVMITDGRCGRQARRRNSQSSAAAAWGTEDRRVRGGDSPHHGPGIRSARAQWPARARLLRGRRAIRSAPARGRRRSRPSRLFPWRSEPPASSGPAKSSVVSEWGRELGGQHVVFACGREAI